MAGQAISLRGVTKRYGALTAVDGLSLEIARGSTVALLGPNGAGKSTTVGMLMGLAAPDAGEVRVAGRPSGAAVTAGAIAAMLQDFGLMPGVTVCELVELVRRGYPDPLPTARALELAGQTRCARPGPARRVRLRIRAGLTFRHVPSAPGIRGLRRPAARPVRSAGL
jgi:ABC-2 type transport system ATP-binding protein